ncbi:MAG: protein kinase, partial [Sandaracinaceae bacterium]|nr:protein kinase [Sandaracinaceae bacterium]
MASLSDSLDLPKAFGPYTLLRRLAVGGMAEVYVAKTKGIGGFEKLVAIKVIHPRFSEDAHFVQMLVEEAKISVQLTHVNIAQTFDLGCIDDTYYIAMELIEGADTYRVQRRLEDRKIPMPLDIAAFIGAEVCNGLAYAHRKRDHEGRPLGIVHRDISPQNVLVSYSGEVKLVDFGIAKAALRGGQTEVGVIKGKYYYMSPEQAWGDPVDGRTDIFATGILLHELLTGVMVYQEENVPALLDRVRKADVPSPRKRRPDVPPELEAIVMKAVAREPADRYPSAQAMAQDLMRFLYAANPTFTAPEGIVNSYITFELQATDGTSVVADTVTITVNADNDAPTADAGVDQTVSERDWVSLGGSASDS